MKIINFLLIAITLAFEFELNSELKKKCVFVKRSHFGDKLSFNWSSTSTNDEDASAVRFVVTDSNNKVMTEFENSKYPYGGMLMEHTETEEYKFCWENLNNNPKTIYLGFSSKKYQKGATSTQFDYINTSLKNFRRESDTFEFYSKLILKNVNNQITNLNNSMFKLKITTVIKLLIFALLGYFQISLLKKIVKGDNRYANVI